MVFKNINEARNWFLKYEEIEREVPIFWGDYDFGNWKFGDYILFQQQTINGISRPIYAIFTNFTFWDQALVINFVQNRRAWTYSHEVITNPVGPYKMKIFELDDEIENIQFWSDNIYVLGHWKSKPSIKELKSSLKNKIVSRDTKLNEILK
jgi:hypothetical protein